MLTLKERKVTLNCLAFSPDGDLLAAGGERGVVQLWDVASGQLRGRPIGLHLGVDFVEFGPAGSLLAAANQAYVWDVEGKGGRIEGRRWLANSYAICLALSPDRRTAFVGHHVREDGDRFGAFRCPEAEPLWGRGSLDFYSCPVTFAFGPGGKVLYTGNRGGEVRAWDTSTGADLGVVVRPGVEGSAIAVSPDGRRLAYPAGSVLHLYALDKPGEVAQHRLGRKHFLSVAFHPSGDFFASANGDGKVDYWDAQTGGRRESFDWQVGKLNDVVFDPTGDRAACCSQSGEIVVWDVDR